jgi:hypothetical protein
MVHPFPIVHVLGPVIAIFGAAMLLPLVVAHVFADTARSAYDVATLVAVVCGSGLAGRG